MKGGSTREASRASLTAGGLGPLKAPRSSRVFGAKSCILAFWRHIISVWKSSIFSLLISLFPITSFFTIFFSNKFFWLTYYLPDSCFQGIFSIKYLIYNIEICKGDKTLKLLNCFQIEYLTKNRYMYFHFRNKLPQVLNQIIIFSMKWRIQRVPWRGGGLIKSMRSAERGVREGDTPSCRWGSGASLGNFCNNYLIKLFDIWRRNSIMLHCISSSNVKSCYILILKVAVHINRDFNSQSWIRS